MGVGAALYMYAVVVKSSRSLSHLLMSSCFIFVPYITAAVCMLLGESICNSTWCHAFVSDDNTK